MLDYWRPGFGKWLRWRGRNRKEILEGNTNTYTEKEQRVDPPIRATKIRFVPYSVHMRTVCMRVELLGCRSNNGLVGYSMLQGYREGPDIDLTDRTYDGIEENGYLSGGLGQLTDGDRGGDNFKFHFRGSGKGSEWVGWKNDTPELLGGPVEITFEFDRVRNFSAMHIFTNNMYTKDVQVFSRALVYFSIGGRQFSSIPVSDSCRPDLLTEHARNVTIKLHHRLARFVKLKLFFANRWILVSEVTFDSVIVNGNFTDEEMENRVILPMEDHGGFSKEYPLQRDEVQTTPSRDDRRQNVAPPSSSFNDSSEPKQYIGLVIGILSTVIIILMAAITFIVVRHRRLRTALGGATNTVIPGGFVSAGPGQKGVPINMKDFQMRVNLNANGHVYGQVSVDEPEDKAAIYHEPFNVNVFSGRKALEPLKGHLDKSRSNYSDIPDIVSRSDDYAVPQISETPPPPFSAPPLTPARALPSLHNFFPKPPSVPPPAEKFYAATEICKTAAKNVPSPKDSLRRTGCSPVYNTLSLSRLLSDNNTDSEFPVTETEDEGCDDDVSVPLIRYDQLRVLEHLGYGQFGEVKLCEIVGKSDYLYGGSCGLVAVKELTPGASEGTREDFRHEVKVLSKINDANIVRVLGACFDGEPVFVVVEYSEFGDLNQYLQEHVADTTTPLPTNAKTLRSADDPLFTPRTPPSTNSSFFLLQLRLPYLYGYANSIGNEIFGIA
ncbi:UNVERIFIED_CONTAM: hypothetical protein PYX00_001759 [Menopon gallinae]|uniref:Discoidin domain receptor n=1 Tax=Menopon gallinae TaxID=328185 RepID=A0AAW2IEB7_9NEOP